MLREETNPTSKRLVRETSLMYYEIVDKNIRVMGALHVFPKGVSKVPRWVEQGYEWSHAIGFEHDAEELQKCFVKHDGSMKSWGAMLQALSEVTAPIVEVGVEGYLRSRMALDGRQFPRMLEDARDLAALLDAVPDADIAVVAKELEDTKHEAAIRIRAMYDAWFTGLIPHAHATAADSTLFTLPTYHNAMLLERNKAWARSICKEGKATQNLLLVVGCFHLCGPGNLVEQLKKRGRKVRSLI